MIHDEHHVIGQARLGDARRAAQIDEHRHHRPLALARRARATRRRRVDAGGQERDHRHVVPRARLAGEPHIRRRLDARQRLRLEALGRRERRQAFADAHAAGGAARAPAAHRGVRQPGVAHRLEDAAADRRGDEAARGMLHLVGAAEPRAQPAREQRRSEQRPESELEPLAPGEHPRALLRLHAGEVEVVLLHAADALDRGPQFVPRRSEARERQAGNQQRGREQHRLHARIPALDAQPVMDAEAEVRPDDQQQDRLAQRRPGVRPQHAHHALIVDVVAEHEPVEARADDVRDEQRRHREPEHELRRLPRRHP